MNARAGADRLREVEPPPEWNVPEADRFDPLAICIAVAARRAGRDTSAEALCAGLARVGHRLPPGQVALAAGRAGLAANWVRADIAALPGRALPAVLLLREGRACLLVERAQDGSAHIVDPEAPDAVAVVTLAELASAYTGIACTLRAVHRFDSRTPEVGDIADRHWFWSVILGNWRLYRDAMVASVLVNLFGLAVPLFSMNVYDRVVPNRALETLWVLAAGALMVLAFDFVLRSVRAYVVDVAAKRVDVVLSGHVMRRVLGMKLSARPLSVGAFAANLRAFESVRDFIASATVTAFIDVPFVLLFLAALLWIAPVLILPPVAGAALVIAVAWVVQARMHALVESSYRATAQRNATLIESLVGIETLKASVAESGMQRKWEDATAFIARIGAKVRLLSTLTINFSMFVQQAVTVVVVIAGVYLLGDRALSLGGIIAASMLAGRAMAPLGAVAALLMQYQNARTSLATLDQQMQLPVERDGRGFLARPGFRGAIELKDVGFAYPGQEHHALVRVSFRIEPGEKVAIIGRVGSGKTTIERLILGLYEPTSGSVLVDGVDARQIDPSELRRAIGFVPQEPDLFFGSLRDNIALSNPAARDSAVLAAADLAGVSEFANAHPHGFGMQVGERGGALSSGQRQAVAIARAVLEEPPMLVMDEPTSGMDHQSEEAFKQRLAAFARGRTLLVVTHRASLLDIVDRMIVVDRGQIVADGPKAAVMEALAQGRVGRAR